jgi:N6-L-threonylcarbamoyladenine synthase
MSNQGTKFKRVLAIETSCDDTSVAVIRQDGFVESLVSANQDLVHAPFGGVVPEIASRNHTLKILPLIDEALKSSGFNFQDLDGVAVTSRPGLVGSLIVGIVTAKSLAQSLKIPMIGVNHLEGHIMAPFLQDQEYSPPKNFEPPFVALAVSGGHTSLYLVKDFGKYEILGTTLDDAAGEAFDKFGKLVGLGFPGGVKVDEYAKKGNNTAFSFPRGMIYEENYSFSFSGLKAAGQRQVSQLSEKELSNQIFDLCASYREAIVDVLIAKLDRAVRHTKIKNVIITGGVSANSRLREVGQAWAAQNKIQLLIPPLRYCTDNAAMIGLVGINRLNNGERSLLTMGPSPSSLDGDFI